MTLSDDDRSAIIIGCVLGIAYIALVAVSIALKCWLDKRQKLKTHLKNANNTEIAESQDTSHERTRVTKTSFCCRGTKRTRDNRKRKSSSWRENYEVLHVEEASGREYELYTVTSSTNEHNVYVNTLVSDELFTSASNDHDVYVNTLVSDEHFTSTSNDHNVYVNTLVSDELSTSPSNDHDVYVNTLVSDEHILYFS